MPHDVGGSMLRSFSLGLTLGVVLLAACSSDTEPNGPGATSGLAATTGANSGGATASGSGGAASGSGGTSNVGGNGGSGTATTGGMGGVGGAGGSPAAACTTCSDMLFSGGTSCAMTKA